MRTIALAVLLLAGSPPASADDAARYFSIAVRDAETGRGVPLVELRTVNNLLFVTDSAGIAALDEPGLNGQKVFFHVASHGYEFPADGFGIRGTAVEVSPGGQAELTIRRLNVAERLYRVTGEGIYRDSLLAGRQTPLRQPLLNAQVVGSDSVMTAVYRGRVHWFWGDTLRPAYPLGNFHVPGATSQLPANGGLAPDVGVDLTYFQDDRGFARETCRMPGDGPTWIEGLVALADESGGERLFAAYMKVRPPLNVYARGLAEFNDERQRFEQAAEFDVDAPLLPGGHPFMHTDEGMEYVYFARGYPLVRVPATAEALADLSRYEAFTCLLPGSTPDEPRLDRGPRGELRYSWKRGAPLLDEAAQERLVGAGLLAADEGWLRMTDAASGRRVRLHAGSVNWNAYRRRWVMIAVEIGGESSHLGEVWYCEADAPQGPWRQAVKVATHERYSFYNPRQQPMFDEEGGRLIYFEGTYTRTFSGDSAPTPRYEYNQIMYRLDLSDPRLKLPAD